MSLSRREFLGAASLGVVGCGVAPRAQILGGFLEPDHAQGHLLRDGLPTSTRPPEILRTGVVIAGGGVAGLSAAWALQRAGFTEFVLLELDDAVGGSARGATTQGLRHPLGAHYVPQPSPESRGVRALFEDLGVITGYEGAEPIFDETMLCQAPEHRLFHEGRWIEGIFPRFGMSARDREDLARVQAELATLRAARDGDGRPALAIPMACSSPDPRWRALDTQTMATWLESLDVTSARVRWWVEYALRDDYGTTLETTSAWAGLHYFCARGLDDPEVLTWPEGNGWLVDRLRATVADHIRTRHLVTRISPGRVEALGPGGPVRIEAERLIVALPHFVAARVVDGLARHPELTYAPWLVAHVHVDQVPPGAAWDNVFHGSDSLGYVVSTHQSLSVRPGPAVLSWYRPYCGADPTAERRRLAAASRDELLSMVFRDLGHAHPNLRRDVTRVDLTRWGHGMIRPTPGFVWGEARARLADVDGPIVYAHSDLSGLSLFEEAQYRGLLAAERVLHALTHPFASLL